MPPVSFAISGEVSVDIKLLTEVQRLLDIPLNHTASVPSFRKPCICNKVPIDTGWLAVKTCILDFNKGCILSVCGFAHVI